MSIRVHAVRSFLVSAAALAVATPAWAQTDQDQAAQAANQATEAVQGDEIIVTATKRATTVQDVPFSINAQTEEDIQRANAQTIEDLSRNVAGLTVQNLGPGQSQVSVRGVSAGQIVRDQPGVKEQVGVYLDESVISLSLFTPDLDLFDLNRVVAYGTKYGGFIDAVGPAGGKNINDGSRVGGRLSILWEPTENIRITPRVVYQEIRADGFNREEHYNFYDNQFTTTGGDLIGKRKQFLLLREKFKDDTLLADLTASIDLGGVELTSITSYMNRDILVSRDASALTGSVTVDFGFPDFADLPSNLRDTTDLKTLTQ